jgi:hypothetical protein
VPPEPSHRFNRLRTGINKLLGVVEPGCNTPAEPGNMAQEIPGEIQALGAGSTSSTERSTEGSHAATPASMHESMHASSHASSHAGSHANGSARSHALTTTRIGDKTRVVNGKGEWSQEDFGCFFLQWFADTFPDAWGSWVWFPDIKKHFFPRFKVATGARYLQLGSLLRGLRAVTQTRPMQYVDGSGRRHTTSEYWMGPGEG